MCTFFTLWDILLFGVCLSSDVDNDGRKLSSLVLSTLFWLFLLSMLLLLAALWSSPTLICFTSLLLEITSTPSIFLFYFLFSELVCLSSALSFLDLQCSLLCIISFSISFSLSVLYKANALRAATLSYGVHTCFISTSYYSFLLSLSSLSSSSSLSLLMPSFVPSVLYLLTDAFIYFFWLKMSHALLVIPLDYLFPLSFSCFVIYLFYCFIACRVSVLSRVSY